MRWWDWLFACLIAGVVGTVSAVLLLPGLTPDAWTGFCEAVGARPPETPFPGLWRLLASWFVGQTGVVDGVRYLRLGGPVSAGLMAAVYYLAVKLVLPGFLNFYLYHPVWERRLMPTVVLVATLAFVFSAPMSAVTQAFTPDAFHLLLALVALLLLFRYVWGRWTGCLHVGLGFCGLLSVETPLGWLMTLVYIVFILYWIYGDHPNNSGPGPSAELRSRRWGMTFTYLGCLILTLVVDVWAFEKLGGKLDVPHGAINWLINWVVGMAQLTSDGATTGGWLMLTLFGLVVTIVTWTVLPRATNDERELPYGLGWIFLASGVFALAQLSGYDLLRYVNWFGGEGVSISPVLCGFAALFASLAFVASLAVLGVELFCRDPETAEKAQTLTDRISLLADLQVVVLTKWVPAWAKVLRNHHLGFVAKAVGWCWRVRPRHVRERLRRTAHRYRRVVAWLLPLVIVACVVPLRCTPGPRHVSALLTDYLELVLKESAGCTCVITDGHFDSALELMAKLRGETLIAHALLGKSNPYKDRLRLRSAIDSEDKAVLETSTAAALRNWVEERTNRLETVGVQLGFEMWRRQKRPLPEMGGTMARVRWPEDPGVAAIRREARELGERLLAAYRAGDVETVERRTRNLFDEAAWRISRMARQRERVADAVPDVPLATQEHELAEALDAQNPSVHALQECLGGLKAPGETVLSPREGLHVALARPDFRMARRFAIAVLAADPDDPDANFGTGMAYLVEEQWSRAEKYLLRVLVRRPEEPVVFNNLAVVYYRQGRYEEAEKWALKATERVMSSPEAKQTLRAIREKLNR